MRNDVLPDSVNSEKEAIITSKINCVIDDHKLAVDKGTTIMQAAASIGIHIPHLCYHPWLSTHGSCRVCIVDVKDMGHYMPACSVPVWEGMSVQTNSPQIRQARRDIVELLIDNHPKDCQTCERDGRCELQNLAYSMGVRERLFEGERKRRTIDNRSVSVVRDPEKCVLCGRCVRVCAEIQGVYNLSQHYRGFLTISTPANERGMDESVCIQCGQCSNVCPTAAYIEKSYVNEVFAALGDQSKHVIVQTAPSIRAAIGEGFGMKTGIPATGKMVSALHLLGFKKVFDTDLGADMTVIEESQELIHRLNNNGPFPLFTSCSPGWINFLEKFYPSLIPYASTCRSPMMMLSVLSKTYYAKIAGIDPKDIFMVAVMPCTAKKFEAARPDHIGPNKIPWTDAVLTTREIIWMIKSYGIDFKNLSDNNFDEPLGTASGAGDIFGITGGVMEAALRTAVEKLTGKAQQRLEFTEVRTVEGVQRASVNLDGRALNVAVANGLSNAKKIFSEIEAGTSEYHMVEIMACPGGCSGGGGQPYVLDDAGATILDMDMLWKRGNALYSIDKSKEIRRSHENPLVKKLYSDFLGEAGGKLSHELLHTHYHARLPRGIR
ncbi:MAG TPA: NADH-dependent [FeFe] hydrogenase, group A6 [Chitinispirillaceae bacterium]|nr:NADH-dependent [FeFe] hydrogenase, group A6 [Chitinispirillaceae bacterium]